MTVLPVLLAGLLLPALEQPQAPICGDVVSYKSRPLQGGGCDLMLVIQPVDTPAGPSAPVQILVTEAARRQAAIPPWAYLQRQACVTGATMSDRAQPTIQVTEQSQLQLQPYTGAGTFGAGALSRCDVPLTIPKILRDVKPHYTADAMRAKIEGVVLLDAVIDTQGKVADARIIRGLDPELDQEALKVLRQWLFEPGTLDGKPVPVMVEVEMTFTIRK